MAEIRQIQVDGVNYDLVISEDEVSATAAAQSAAQALAYKNQAQSSATQAAQQATNASNQADRAEDAASRAEQIVGGEFLSYGGDQGLDFDQQDQARENIGKATFKSASGSLVSIEHAANIPLKSLIANIKPIQTGSGDPSPSNVRPIYGHTNAHVSESRKNLFKITASSTTVNGVTFTVNSNGTVTANGTATAEAQLVLGNVRPIVDAFPNAELQFICCPSGGGSTTYKADISNASAWDYGTGPKNVYRSSYTYQSFRIFVCAGYTANNVVFTPMIFKANETDTTFEKFEGTTHSITFPSSAGTVYGGTLNVKTGVLTKKYEILDMGTLTWTYESGSGYDNQVRAQYDAAKYRGDGYCSHYALQKTAVYNTLADKHFSFTNTQSPCLIRVHDSSYSDAASFQAALSGVKLVYELATPVTYQCTPTEVTALLGLNNIWADTGDVSLEYLEQGVLTEEYAKYEEERIPQIATKMFSNRNLLDNPFFTINQRGFTTSTETNGLFSVDRWFINNGGGTVTKTANGITINNTSGTRYNTFQQRFGADELAGKTVTLSIDADGSIYKQTFTIPARTSSTQTMCNWAWKTGCNLRFYVETTSANASYNVQIYVANGYSTDLRAIKLEIGSVSTLANDAPPDYNSELRKCRYYFRRITNPAGGAQWCMAGFNATTTVAIFVLDNPMRNATKTISYSGGLQVNGVSVTSVGSYTRGHDTTLSVVTGGRLTVYGGAGLIIGANGYLDISADL